MFNESEIAIQQQIIATAEARIATWPKWKADSLRAQIAALGRNSTHAE